MTKFQMFAENNAIYLIAGYVVFLGGISTYLLTLVLRQRNLKRDEQLLEQIAEQLRTQEEQRDSSVSAVAQHERS